MAYVLMEVAITVAIGEGKSAASLSRDVRRYLNDPELMFRRFRYKDPETGEWRRKWKKRVMADDGKVHFIDYDKDSYRDEWTGPGYYKSSAQNAMRVARSETNIAYRRADHERWAQMDFVLGQRIHLSRSHPREDICDDLAGDYPKEFVFDGWHPQCFCYVTPILIDEDEMQKEMDAFMNGETYTPQGEPVTDYPANFKRWVTDNADKIAAARERGTEPYFISNNATAIDGILNSDAVKGAVKPSGMKGDAPKAKAEDEERRARNRDLYDKLKDNPVYWDVVYHEKSGGVKATHIGHNFDDKKGWYESSAQNVGYMNGHSVIFKKEDHTKHKIKNNEGIWDGIPFEVAGCETGIDVNIRNGLKHCASKPDTQIAILFFPNDNFDVSIFEAGYAKYFGLRHDPKQYRKFDIIYCVNKEKIIYIKKPD